VRLLLTRPQPDAERTAAMLRARGHSVTIAPLLRIEAIVDAELGSGPWAAILVTSANAARAIAAHKRFAELQPLPAIAVGEQSARALRTVGFADVSFAEGGASDLARLVAERLKRGAPLLYLAGADRSGDIAHDLGGQNFVVRTVVVYRAIAADVLPSAAAEALASGIDGVLHFSRRSAETYAKTARADNLHEKALKRPTHFCLSAQVAEVLAQAGAANVRIAPQPAETALVALVPAAGVQ
jgi:uroporphyrinogen-III synthase